MKKFDCIKFEKEMQKKYPAFREITEEEELSNGVIRYNAWLYFPYYSSNSNGGFFSFFTEEEFYKYITTTVHKWTAEEIIKSGFEPDQYEEFCCTNMTYDEKYNTAIEMLKRLNNQ